MTSQVIFLACKMSRVAAARPYTVSTSSLAITYWITSNCSSGARGKSVCMGRVYSFFHPHCSGSVSPYSPSIAESDRKHVSYGILPQQLLVVKFVLLYYVTYWTSPFCRIFYNVKSYVILQVYHCTRSPISTLQRTNFFHRG